MMKTFNLFLYYEFFGKMIKDSKIIYNNQYKSISFRQKINTILFYFINISQIKLF